MSVRIDDPPERRSQVESALKRISFRRYFSIDGMILDEEAKHPS